MVWLSSFIVSRPQNMRLETWVIPGLFLTMRDILDIILTVFGNEW